MSNWGNDLTVISASDYGYLAGVYALFNSLRLNGFVGRFQAWLIDDPDISRLPKAKDLSYHLMNRDASALHPHGARFSIYHSLPEGKYAHLDSDIIVERPCGFVFEQIESGLVVSVEPEAKYELRDWSIAELARRFGVQPPQAIGPYLNAGILGFNLPRDFHLLSDLWKRVQVTAFSNGLSQFQDPSLPIPDQDLLNFGVLEHIDRGVPCWTVSHRRVEIGSYELFRDRSFSLDSQTRLQPADQRKFLIHGAALRRPWMSLADSGIRGGLERLGILPMYRRLRNRLSAYERGWAYYAYHPHAPIPASKWAKAHHLPEKPGRLWTNAYGPLAH